MNFIELWRTNCKRDPTAQVAYFLPAMGNTLSFTYPAFTESIVFRSSQLQYLQYPDVHHIDRSHGPDPCGDIFI
jgi:hypothetical protein